MINKLFLPLWAFGSFLLFLYSYTQVDLSLTLSRSGLIQDVQKGFQYIGWFNRPLSTLLYICVFLILFVLYIITLKFVDKGVISKKTIWKAILIVTVFGTLSYNAFSYDLFNYIFDAKIVTFYNSNPYLHKALDFPADPMLSFMRWTHRMYPYGPIWLAITIPLSFIGAQIFIVTFFLFKLFISAFFILSAWIIYKISKLLKLPNSLLPLVAFALNPFVILEGLVSAHNDLVMMGLSLTGIYYIFQAKYLKGWIFVAFSIGVKFATALLIPAYVEYWRSKNKTNFIIICTIMMAVAVILATVRTTFQPWYLLYIMPFAVFFIHKQIIKIILLMFSLGAVIYYVPFLFTGNWDHPIPSILNWIIAICAITSALYAIIYYFLTLKGSKK